jgi:perosamine synthetase
LAVAILANIPFKNQIGRLNSNHSHWVLPIEAENPAQLILDLRTKGIDATSKASSLISLETGRKNKTEQLELDQLVYLPIDKALLKITWKELC